VELLEIISAIIGIIASIIITWGALITAFGFIRNEIDKVRSMELRRSNYYLRFEMGTYLLLGLEFLVAADVIRTLIRPDLDGIIILAAIVIIRTIVSYFLSREVEKYEGQLEKGKTGKSIDST
jgi:uncharacterized membrane protein